MSDEPPVCIACGDEYSLHDGFEVTDYCDPCAQELAAEMGQLLLGSRVDIGGNWRENRDAVLKKAGLL